MDRVCVGVVVGAHGIRGAVRVKCFTDAPEDLDAYGPLSDDGGKHYTARVTGVVKGLALVSLDGVTDRNRAEGLKGMRLYVPRDALLEGDGADGDEDEFLVADLIGARAVNPQGVALGTVKGVYDFGAGDVLEINGPQGSIMVPFTRLAVPEVDVRERKVVVDPPPFAAEDEDERSRPE